MVHVEDEHDRICVVDLFLGTAGGWVNSHALIFFLSHWSLLVITRPLTVIDLCYHFLAQF